MQLELLLGAIEHSLSDETICAIRSLDGWGEAPLHRLVERGPQQHGASDIGFRLDPRVGTVVLSVDAGDLATLWTRRALLLSWLRPTSGEKTLRFTLDDGTVRCFEGHSAGQMTLPLEARRALAWDVGVQFVCADPTCYDPEAQTLTFRLGGSAGTGFTVPTYVPTGMGASVIAGAQAVAYAGTWRTHPTIRITGPITDCVITNESTGETIDFTGVTIEAGETRDIDLRYGHKTVLDAEGANCIAEITPQSDLATFHIADDQEVEDGINTIRVTGTDADAATRIDMTWFIRYTGI